MGLIKLISSLLTAVFIGWNVLYPVSFKNSRLCLLESLFVSFGLGLGVLSLEMFIFFILNLKFSLLGIIGPWILLFIFNLVLYYAAGKNSTGYKIKETKYTSGNYFIYFIIACLGFTVLYAFFRALIKPIEAYDAIAIYAIKSKIFFMAKSIPHDYFRAAGLLFPHPDYPLNIPLSETFVYMFLGRINEQLVKSVFPLYYVAALGILYFGIRRFSSRTYALVFTFILASVSQFNNFATNGYMDLPLAYYYLAGTLFLFYWFRETDKTGFLYISAIMTALAGWTKNEGLVCCAANVILLTVFLFSNRSKIKSRFIMHGIGYAAVIMAALLPWLSVRNAAHLVNSDFGVLNADQFNIIKQSYKIWPILYEFQRQIFGPNKWNILWMIIILMAVVYRKKIFTGGQKYVTISLILPVCGYALAHIFAQKEIVFLMRTVWSRQMIHFVPIAVYWLAYLLKDDIKI